MKTFIIDTDYEQGCTVTASYYEAGPQWVTFFATLDGHLPDMNPERYFVVAMYAAGSVRVVLTQDVVE